MDEKDRRYKIMCSATTGWTIIDQHAHNLTKEECDKWIADLFSGIQLLLSILFYQSFISSLLFGEGSKTNFIWIGSTTS